MEFVSYNAELALANLLFQRVFSNIQIERTDKAGKKSWLKVPCVNATRARIIKSLENRDRQAMYKLPMIAFNRTGYQRQGDRLNNLHNEVKYEITSSWRNYQLLAPVPVDISYDLTVFAKYQADIDKIASNFMVFFNNDVYVSQEHPKYQGVKLNNQIVMADSVGEEHPDELDGTQDDVVTSNFQFTFKTYLFGGTQQYKKAQVEVSSFLSTTVSSVVYEFKDDKEVLQFLSSPDHPKLSSIISTIVEVPVEVSSEVSSDMYDDGIPRVNKIEFGFYAVPRPEDIEGYIMSVDSGLIAKHEHYTKPAYISSESYERKYRTEVDPYGDEISVPWYTATSGDWYEPVDNWCTLAPYVDRLRWKIDQSSPYPFPYNVKTYRDFEDLSGVMPLSVLYS